MKILIVNDDGFKAEGLKVLVETLKVFGELYLASPYKHNSGMSNAITIRKKIKYKKINFPHTKEAYYVKGTPADCTRISSALFHDIKFDLLVSGINEGANIGSNIMHSGTIGAAMEGANMGLLTIAFSSPVGNYYNAKKYGKQIVETIIKEKLLSTDYVLNVNYPKDDSGVNGVYFSKEADNYSINNYQSYKNAHKPLYKRLKDDDKLTDVYGYYNNYITVTPILRVNNDLSLIKELNDKKINFNI